MPGLALLLACAASLAPAPAGGGSGAPLDAVVLDDGERLEGHVVYRDGQGLVLRRGRRDARIEAVDVARIELVRDREWEVVQRAARLFHTDAGGSAALAREAAGLGLDGEARILWRRALLADPGHEEARRGLGRGARDWVAAARSGTRRERGWRDAWELETLHYTLRTNLAPRPALETALDLERLYHGFFALLGVELHRFQVVERLGVHVHADGSSYPEVAREGGYFDPSDGILRVDASRGLALALLAHEVTHQLFFATAVSEHGAPDTLPAWLDEGLASYLGACVVGEPGALALEPGRVDAATFARHAREKDPLSLRRVLTLGLGDFSSSTLSERAYAQSYTLVHYCLHGAGGALREPFLAFVREAGSGQVSAAAFERRLGRDEHTLEEGWVAHVEDLAPRSAR